MKRSCVLVLVGVLALLAGCSDGDPEPKIAPTDSSSAASSTSPSPSPSPSGPVEPSLPAEAEGEDAAAAEAFVRFYWEMVNYAQATGAVGGLRAIADSTCAACEGGLNGISEAYSSGGEMRGGNVEVTKAVAAEYRAGDLPIFIVDVQARVDPQTVIAGDGSRTKFPGGTETFEMLVDRAEGSWRVTRMDPK